MNKSKVFVRVDGSKNIGLGHAYRCYALAQMLEQEFQIDFWCKEITKSLKSKIENRYKVHIIDDEESFIHEIRSTQPIVICDGYKFKEEYQRVIKKEGASLVCIDDIHNTRFVADLVLNHSPAVTKNDYRTTVNTKLLLGLDYVLLRQPFLEMARKIEQRQEISTVFICFGGIDKYNLTLKCAEAVSSFDSVEVINLVIGNNNPQIEHVSRFADQTSKNVNIYNGIDAKKFSQLLRISDLSIVPSSSVLFESLSAKNFIVTGHYVENQRNISKYFSDNNAKCIKSVGNFKNISIQELSEVLGSFINLHDSNFVKCKSYIDGFSGQRIRDEFKKLKK